MVRYWWGPERWPDANVGIACGPSSGIWTLDIDQHGDIDGEQALAQLGELPATIEAATGGGGRHLIWAWDEDAPPIGCPSTGLPGLDVRGEGGYIVAPPSNHASGKSYEWVSGPDRFKPVLAPAALTKRFAGQPVPESVPMPEIRQAERPLPPDMISAISAVPADLSYPDWRNVGMAIHDESGGSELGWRAFHRWSKTGTATYKDEEDCRKIWCSFAGRQNPIGKGTLFALAYEHGWVDEAPTQVGTVASWPTPEPLRSEQPAIPFDLLRFFPPGLGWLADTAADISVALQVPEEATASLMLPIASATLAGKVVFAVPGEAWEEHPAIWVILAMPSGTRKSAIMRHLLKPIRSWERALKRDPKYSALHVQSLTISSRIKKATRDLEKGGSGALQASDELVQALQDQTAFESTRDGRKPMLLSDATAERFVGALSERDGRVLIADSEGAIFATVLGRYSSGIPALEPLLQSYDCENITQHRVYGDREVESPLMSMSVTTQPEAIEVLYRPEVVARGFTPRISVVCLPRVPLGVFCPGVGLDPQGLMDWERAISDGLNTKRFDAPRKHGMSKGAHALFTKAGQDFSDRFKTSPMTPSDAKHMGKVVRVAGTYACLRGADETSEQDIDAALYAVDFWAKHSAASEVMVGGDKDAAIGQRIIDWLARSGTQGTVKTSEIVRALGGGGQAIRTVADISGALALLCECHWLRPIGKVSTRSRSPIPTFVAYEAAPNIR